ncbi:winged helix-turn-helix domain-containing protein [Desulfovibrio inopinatus]|uniref:winged helix-turn-helix domain-containing protein n=1 Tax=Desulfovibrio inopinatus TaxID=102109 RepID=UPI00042302EA|nr:LysR family transcriptional regulator [Desulfovibrio inopinatus]
MDDPVLRMHMWLEVEGVTFFGLGRTLILERLAQCGSLQKAARSLGITHEAALEKIHQTEQMFGFKLIERVGGDKPGTSRRLRLTIFGELLSSAYRQWSESVERFALQQAMEIFPFPCRSYDASKEDIVTGHFSPTQNSSTPSRPRLSQAHR